MRRVAPAIAFLSAAVAAFSVVAASSAVWAGPVAGVARGIENKVDTHQSDPPSSPSSPDDPGPSDSDDDSYDTTDTAYPTTGCYHCRSSAGVSDAAHTDGRGWTPPVLVLGPGRLDIYLGAHAVSGSDGAVVGSVRASKGWIGISAANTSYFEKVEDKPGSDSIRMDLMAFSIEGRILKVADTELWLTGGLAASTSTEYDGILGTAFGARAEHPLVADLGLVGQARFFNLEHDVSAAEGYAGVRAWYLAAGYRVTKFNVGSALHGPEAGLSLRF